MLEKETLMNEEVNEDVTPEEMTTLEKKAMTEMDELVDLFAKRNTRAQLMAREHDRMIHMIRNQEDKLKVYEMRQAHVNELLAQLEGKLNEATDENQRYVLKDQCAALMKELRHLQHAIDRSQMMIARFKNEAESRLLDIESMKRSQRRTIEKAQTMKPANTAIKLNDEETIAAKENAEVQVVVREEILSQLKAKLETMDAQALNQLLWLTEKAQSAQFVIDTPEKALKAIAPKVDLIRTSNLYELLSPNQRARIDAMIEEFEHRIRSADEPKVLAVLINDFEKTAFPRIFRKMAECIR